MYSTVRSVVPLALGAFVLAPWPLFIIGGLGYLLGTLALAVTALRTGVLPRSAAWMLIAAVILAFFFNSEDDRAMMAIAPGIAFFALGARSLLSVAR